VTLGQAIETFINNRPFWRIRVIRHPEFLSHHRMIDIAYRPHQ